MCLVVPGVEDQVETIGPCTRIYSVASRHAPLNPDYRLMLPNAYLRKGGRLRQILREEKPDVVEVCDKYTLNYLAAMLRTQMMGDVTVRPLVVGLSCERMDDNVRAYLGWNKPARWLVNFYMKWLYFSFFDHHIANSEYTAEELRTASSGHVIRRGVWIRPMGVNTRDLSPRHRSSVARHGLLQQVGAESGSILLLYVGRLAPEKNLPLLIDTLEVLQREGGTPYHLILVGDGVRRSEFLAQAAARTPNRVTWLGHVRDRSELARIYANCDVFLHPNPREPFGIAPLEAMASGLPVVVPDSGGVTTYADSTNAWVVPPSANSFARAVMEAATNAALRDQKAGRALETAFNLRWDRVADSFLDLYEDLGRLARGQATRTGADFYSTAPRGKGSPVARLTASVVQRLLATR